MDWTGRSTSTLAARLAFIWGIVLLAVLRSPGRGTDQGPIQNTLDPNSACWWELMVLPEIGETVAKDVVRFREQACSQGAVQAFRHIGDLDQVRGIGPKTLARLSPYLRFEDRCPPSPE